MYTTLYAKELNEDFDVESDKEKNDLYARLLLTEFPGTIFNAQSYEDILHK